MYAIGIDSDGGEHAATSSTGSGIRPIAAGPLFERGTQIDATVRLGRLSASTPARDALGP